ncbi:MAG: DUF4834 family protein [Lutibacter sp.]|uniref:DUF4834 domain-containing protein n=1 Tax=Lutibacter sp. TaxID=1925666 RepID=UPI00181701FC|nr:DUF4834 domain-containing protein [Lutibacter sp.]MBT8317518.1 DUF4834 family protein [Lutibacter sp.]NNJ58377.1 DUF4834 family protein [Lutibacter sp.]
MGLLRTIAIIIIVYYAFKFIGKYIMPLFLKRVVKNVEKKMREQQENQYKEDSGNIGETVIAKKPQVRKESNKDVGDYVDYEEVKDDK